MKRKNKQERLATDEECKSLLALCGISHALKVVVEYLGGNSPDILKQRNTLLVFFYLYVLNPSALVRADKPVISTEKCRELADAFCAAEGRLNNLNPETHYGNRDEDRIKEKAAKHLWQKIQMVFAPLLEKEPCEVTTAAIFQNKYDLGSDSSQPLCALVRAFGILINICWERIPRSP